MTTTAPTTTTHTGPPAPIDDASLKERHRRMWASGDYPTAAALLIPDLGAELVDACDIRAGQRVLDVACGSGNATIPAAERGAVVTGADLTPALLDAAADAARSAGVDIDWQEADVESLPFRDGTFDVVMSCVGAMFAPHHRATAEEILRVCRPGGTVGLLNWTSDGFIARMLAAMRPFAPPPVPGTDPPVSWGDPSHVTDLFGRRVRDLDMRTGTVTVSFADPAAFRECFATMYGPIVAVYAADDDPARIHALDTALEDLARDHDRGSDEVVLDWEYLTATGRIAP